MKLFLASVTAACCVLALPAFAVMAASDGSSTPTSQSMTGGATLKVQSVTTTTTVTTNEEGVKSYSHVTRLECAGSAHDCKINRNGEAVYVTPTGL
jgi:hypothetical protein